MTTPIPQASAKIYRFPIRARAVAADRPIETRQRSTPIAPPTVCGSGWYHDAAIQDEQRTGKR